MSKTARVVLGNASRNRR